MELRDLLSCQFKSASVYGIFGLISYKSASAAFACVSATLPVTPLAEKYATNFLLISNPPCSVFSQFWFNQVITVFNQPPQFVIRHITIERNSHDFCTVPTYTNAPI
jgi:hypothetical protein